MGGLLIADSVLRMQAHKQHPEELLWPRVIAVIAFDTPVSRDRLALCVLSFRRADTLFGPPTVPRSASTCLCKHMNRLSRLWSFRSPSDTLSSLRFRVEKRYHQIQRPHRDCTDSPLYRLWVDRDFLGLVNTYQDGEPARNLCLDIFLLFPANPTIPLESFRRSSRWSCSGRNSLLAER
jgi:hypothetical protein